MRRPDLYAFLGIDDAIRDWFEQALARRERRVPRLKGRTRIAAGGHCRQCLHKIAEWQAAPDVFRLFGRIMVEKPRRRPTVRLIALGKGPDIKVGEYHTYVLGAIRKRAKRMFVEDVPAVAPSAGATFPSGR